MGIRFILPLLLIITSVLRSEAQIAGCTDPLANNFNSSATINDGSCQYNQADIKPVSSFNLASVLSETSGLIFWNNCLWTHNDNTDTDIYCLDTLNGSIIKTYHLQMVENIDWEEVSQDENYIYIGDFGNNDGDRRDLKILRIDKSSLLNETPSVDSIMFSYSDQYDFNQGTNNTDFDCEALVVTDDSIYLFTKQWISKKTSLYSLPKIPGNHIAELRGSLDVDGLITGAVFLKVKNLIVMTGYSGSLSPFLYLLYDFTGNDFFGGNKRKIDILLPYHQVEGIATNDGFKFYISNESFSFSPLINVDQQLHIFNLTPFLGNYLGVPEPQPDAENNYIIIPNPAHDYLNIKSLPDLLPQDCSIINMSGQVVKTEQLKIENSTVNISGLAPGIYILKIGEGKKHSYKVIIQ
jgi:hypothetical protein